MLFGTTRVNTDLRSSRRTPTSASVGFVEGPPPKIVWLDVGNAATDAMAALLVREHARVFAFDADEEASLIVLSLATPAE